MSVSYLDLYNENEKSRSDVYNNSKTENPSTNSKDNSQGDKKSFLLNNDLKNILFCNRCKGPFKIDFLDNLDLSLDCSCSLLINMTVEEHLRIDSYKKQNEDYILFCQRHPKETKFEYFCPDCDYDLCQECLNEDSKTYTNTRKKYKMHENHTKIKLDEIIQKFQNIKDKINECKNIKENKIYKKVQVEKIIKIFEIINEIIKLYPKYMCFNFYKTIENSETFLDKIKNNYIFGKHIDLISLQKITSEKNFIHIKDFSYIESINIKCSQNPIDFSIFKDKEFPYLKIIKLVGIRINNIESLNSCKFPELERLHFERNEIDDSIIETLKKLDLPKLNFLSLFKNKIKNLEIFNVIKKFDKLTAFHIGENKFDFSTDNKSNYEFPNGFIELGLTGNFDGDNIDFIKKLGIDNLKIFYFSRNKITSLKCLEGIEFKQLEKFWSISNELIDIKDITYIKNKDNLIEINLRENKISNFEELKNIICQFPKLKTLILSDNEKIKESEVKEMIKNIKKEHNIDLIIEI